MATANGSTVTYDAFGRAVAGPSGEILYTPLGKVGVLQSSTRFYTSSVPLTGGEAMSLGCCSSDNVWYLHRDWTGTSRVISTVPTSGNGGWINDRSFSPFGDVYQNSGYNDPLFFAGMNAELFATSGTSSPIYDTPNRELAKNASRLLSPDPAGLFAVDITNPQSWNRYAYVNNRPLTTIDPSGLGGPPIVDGNEMFGAGHCTNVSLDAGSTICTNLTGSFLDWFDLPVRAYARHGDCGWYVVGTAAALIGAEANAANSCAGPTDKNRARQKPGKTGDRRDVPRFLRTKRPW